MKSLRRYGLGTLLLSGGILLGCGESNGQNTPPEYKLPVIAAVSQEADLSSRYGKEAAKYALRVIENGKRIKNSPGKQEHLYGRIEAGLREKYPLITPPRLFGYIDDEREAPNIAILFNARERVLPRARKHGIVLPMSFIIAALCNEGHSLDVDRDSDGLDGFETYGLDTFGTEFSHIADLGYLEKDFRSRFTTAYLRNERGVKVNSSRFESKEDAFEAFIATLARRQYLFFEDLRKNRIPRSKIPGEQILFFTYKYYNGGPDSAERLLRSRSPKKIGEFFRRTITYGSTGNAYVVLSGHQWLEQAGAADPNPEGKYWWYE